MTLIKFTPLNPEIPSIVTRLIVSVVLQAFGSSQVRVTLKGSSVKGDFIEGYSDFF